MGNCANSCIAHPKEGDKIKVKKWNQKLILKGWAVGDGEKGTGVAKVQLSFDSGKTWSDATGLKKEEAEEGKKVFSWALWSYELDLKPYPAGKEANLKVMVRSVDSDGVIQQGKPEE